MENSSIKFKLYYSLIVTAASLILVWNIVNTNWNTPQIINLLTFGILAIACESLPVALPKGGYVTVSYSIFLSSLILFPLGVTLLAMALSGLILFGKVGLVQPLYKRVFNASQYVIALAAAYHVISFFQVPSFRLDIKSFLIYLLAAVVYMVINMVIVAIILSIVSNKSPWSIWVSNFRWALPNFMALVPLGFLLALVYNSWGPPGLFLLFIPLLVSRHSFQLYVDMRENYLNTVEALVQALEAKDSYTSGHSSRVGKLTVAMGEAIGMNDDKLQFLKYAAVLHDVGKIGVSEIILNKEGKLLEVEWESIHSHPVIGQTIIENIKFMFDIGQVVRHHHERFDGQGYPDQIKGEDIPLESRIISVADTYDAITSDRSYRVGRSHEEAINELKNAAGSQLDPQLVELFCKIVSKDMLAEIVSSSRVKIA